jgi:hypothetical protein
VFEGGDNAVRVALLALSGLVLAFGALRARRTLRRAVALARERANLARHFSQPIADVIPQANIAELGRGRRQASACALKERPCSRSQLASATSSRRDGSASRHISR